MVIICITTSIIFTFNTHGKYSIPQVYHLNYDVIIRNHEHYLRYGIHRSKCYLQRYFETCPIVSNISTNCPKANCKYLWKTQKYLLIKVHEEWKLMATCVIDVHFVGCTQPSPCEQAQSKRFQQEAEDWKWTPALVHPWPKYSWRPLQENQVFEEELEIVPSAFCHPLPDVNSAQGLWYQLKSKGWWNSIIFLKTVPPAKGELKLKYPNFNKLML